MSRLSVLVLCCLTLILGSLLATPAEANHRQERRQARREARHGGDGGLFGFGLFAGGCCGGAAAGSAGATCSPGGCR